jgi:hypothetical protein
MIGYGPVMERVSTAGTLKTGKMIYLGGTTFLRQNISNFETILPTESFHTRRGLYRLSHNRVDLATLKPAFVVTRTDASRD